MAFDYALKIFASTRVDVSGIGFQARLGMKYGVYRALGA